MEFTQSEETAKNCVSTTTGIIISIKWKCNVFKLQNCCLESTTISQLKTFIQTQTKVPIDKQKIIGIGKPGQKLEETSFLSTFHFKLKDSTLNLSLIGTPEEELLKPSHSSVRDSIINDFSHTFSPVTREWKKLQDYTQSTDIQFINEPRPGKKLLVLDLDHTLLDFTVFPPFLPPRTHYSISNSTVLPPSPNSLFNQ